MNNIILDALDYFYSKMLEGDVKFALTPEIIETMPIAIVNNVKMKYNVLGVLNNNGEFIWAWHLNIAKNKFIKSKKLLTYAIEKEVCTLQDAYIKTMLTTSKHAIRDYKDNTTFIILIALSIYLTKAHHVYFADIDGYKEIYGLYEI